MNTEKNKSNFQFQEPRLVESIFIENPNYKGKFQEILKESSKSTSWIAPD